MRPDEFGRDGCRTRWGADEKVIIERLCISLPYVETFNSKVIKGFVPELRSRYVFFVFRDSYVLCIYVMNILCTFHISVSWVWYNLRELDVTQTFVKYYQITLVGTIEKGVIIIMIIIMMQQNSSCILCGDREETINHIIIG